MSADCTISSISPMSGAQVVPEVQVCTVRIWLQCAHGAGGGFMLGHAESARIENMGISLLPISAANERNAHMRLSRMFHI